MLVAAYAGFGIVTAIVAALRAFDFERFLSAPEPYSERKPSHSQGLPRTPLVQLERLAS